MIDYHFKPDHYRHARNAYAYALGRQERGGFKVRRVVWGRLMARAERREGEEIRRAFVMIEGVGQGKRKAALSKTRAPPQAG